MKEYKRSSWSESPPVLVYFVFVDKKFPIFVAIFISNPGLAVLQTIRVGRK